MTEYKIPAEPDGPVWDTDGTKWGKCGGQFWDSDGSTQGPWAWHELLHYYGPLRDYPPEPDWLDAPAVIARHVKQEPDSPPSLWANLGDGMWGHAETTKRATALALRDVTPLYPKERAGSVAPLYPKGQEA